MGELIIFIDGLVLTSQADCMWSPVSPKETKTVDPEP